jgi:short-subunit dehydrogenase
MTDSDRPRALITGATSGIGAAFARRLARDGHDLILHGRREALLDALAAELRQTHGIDAEVLIAELADPAAVRAVETRVAGLDRLDLLVNNAGYWTPGTFWERDPDDIEAMIHAHVIAAVRLVRAALPGMIARGRGAIVNVSSIAAFWNSPTLETYAATKAYLVSFSETLHLALHGTGVRVHVAAPGWTRTNFHPRIGQDHDEMARQGVEWMAPETVVEAALRDLARGRVVGFPSFKDQRRIWLARLVPRRLYYWRYLRHRRT